MFKVRGVTVAVIVLSGAVLRAQPPISLPKTVMDGLYTAEQASRGRIVYERVCAECHMLDLAGHEYAGALAGFGFQLKWQDASVSELFGRVRSMPLGRPGWLTEQDYLDIVAYVLEKNEYPAGARELTREIAAQQRPRIVIERLQR